MKLRFFDIAKAASKKAEHHSHQIGAVIVKKNRVISIGANKLKSHPKSRHPFKSLHAEHSAILGIDKKHLEGASIYVFRQLKSGTNAMAKPCAYCEMALRDCGLKSAYWTKEGGYGYQRYR